MGGGRAPCCDKTKVKKGSWSPAEDVRLVAFIQKHGHGNWRSLPKQAGLLRCGKSCRLRWINYLRPDVKRGNFTPQEEATIIKLHSILGNKWAKIASHLPGRTDNEIKNVWNTHLKKRSLLLTNNNDDDGNHFSKEKETVLLSMSSPSNDQSSGAVSNVSDDNVMSGDQCTNGNDDDNITSTNYDHDQQKAIILAPMDIDNDEDDPMINDSKETSSPISTISSSFSSSPCNDKQESEAIPPHDDQSVINPTTTEHHQDDNQGSVATAATTVDIINREEHFPPDIPDVEFWNMLESLDDGDYHDDRLVLIADDGDAQIRLADTIIHDDRHPLHYSQSSSNNDFTNASTPPALLFDKEDEALNEMIMGSVEYNKWMKYLENELRLVSDTTTPADQFDTDSATYDKGVIDSDEFFLPPSPNNFTVD